ncbi:MAG: hypothetical protein U0802_07965 [Candidatus Binatia bacterium]
MLAVTGLYLFGWAKPVPVHFGNLRHPKRDMVFVALAGPGTNLVLAVPSRRGARRRAGRADAARGPLPGRRPGATSCWPCST